MFKTIQSIHFVGIGGAGMSGIAEVLINLGYKVSGSDLKETDVTARLKQLGASLHYGHKKENVGEAQVVVTSTAVKTDNPEVIFAREHKIPVIPRIEMLAEIARLKYTIAVAGTHGKTTTTSLVASILQEAGLDPTFIIGGKLKNLQSGAKLGQGDFMVAEADESDGSFLKLSPTYGIITNIDNDHMDYYKTEKNLFQAFVEFGNRVPFYGAMIICADDPGIKTIAHLLKRRVITYGLRSQADYQARNIAPGLHSTTFEVEYQGEILGKIELKLSGKHNVSNALAAVICGLELKVPFARIADALKDFENAQRRLEIKAEKNGAVWVDDYGHHPTEIRATISALREKFPDRKLRVLFQPHRYSRTKLLMNDFGKCFEGADEVLLLPIYAASEKPIPGVSSDKILSLLKKNKVEASLVSAESVSVLKSKAEPGSVMLTLGAGDVWKLGEKVFLME